jgi:hypothetical protein
MDGWIDRWCVGLRRWDQEGLLQAEPYFSSLAPGCGGGRGMTDQEQGCVQLGHNLFWGNPIKLVDSQQDCACCFKAVVCGDTL